MSKNILYLLTALITFQPASACYSTTVRLENAIVENSLDDFLQEFRYLISISHLGLEESTLTIAMLEQYCKLSKAQIINLQIQKQKMLKFLNSGEIANQSFVLALTSYFTGVATYRCLNEAYDHSDYDRSLKYCLFILLWGGVSRYILKDINTKFEKSRDIEKRLNQQESILRTLEQTLSSWKCLYQTD